MVARTRVFTLAESLGAVESLIEHPGRMTHAVLARSSLAVDPSLVRLSVGIETVDDLLADLDRAPGMSPTSTPSVRTTGTGGRGIGGTQPDGGRPILTGPGMRHRPASGLEKKNCDEGGHRSWPGRRCCPEQVRRMASSASAMPSRGSSSDPTERRAPDLRPTDSRCSARATFSAERRLPGVTGQGPGRAADACREVLWRHEPAGSAAPGALDGIVGATDASGCLPCAGGSAEVSAGRGRRSRDRPRPPPTPRTVGGPASATGVPTSLGPSVPGDDGVSPTATTVAWPGLSTSRRRPRSWPVASRPSSTSTGAGGPSGDSSFRPAPGRSGGVTIEAKGWVVVSVNYRLAPRFAGPPRSTTPPAPSASSSRRRRAAHRSAAIGAIGDSAGGQIVALLGLAGRGAGFGGGAVRRPVERRPGGGRPRTDRRTSPTRRLGRFARRPGVALDVFGTTLGPRSAGYTGLGAAEGGQPRDLRRLRTSRRF